MYKHLQKLEELNLLDTLVKQGIISITLAGQKMIYEVYLKERSSAKNKTEAVVNTSIETNTPERTIYRIIKAMEN